MTSILSPSCIFHPDGVEQLSAALHELAGGNCRFAIKSGGHNPNLEANYVNNGVSIDQGNLNQTLSHLFMRIPYTRPRATRTTRNTRNTRSTALPPLPQRAHDILSSAEPGYVASVD